MYVLGVDFGGGNRVANARKNLRGNSQGIARKAGESGTVGRW